VIQNQFAPQTETYASIPLFKELARDRFEVILYALAQATPPAEEQCRSLADRFVVLPAEPKAQADAIRADDLDVLFFGTNLTAVTHPLVLLASLRLARVQATALHSPVTTGMETMDRFLLGLAGRDAAEAERAYVEELAVIDEPGMAFDFTSRPPPSDFKVDRAALNVPADAVLFASGANFYKIIPEVRRAWARILAAVPGSYLVLYPFGPAWSNQYAAGGFLRSFYTTLAEHGVEGRRLVVMQPLPSPADIGKLLAVCDVYLDSFPYAGAVSMIDALEAAVPPVAVAGGPQRFAQAAALLRSVGLDELIAGDAEDYVQLAVALARDPGRRERLSDEVRRRMADGPRFLDTGWYAGQVAGLFEKICGK
jgi:predicted O-linked N-acetylglucosamine transferase (SPINDLY family)